MQPMDGTGEGSRPMIEARGLEKRFGDVVALAGIDFTVESGEVFGLLGPNGAGKTTAIRILTGLARADAGRLRIAGIDLIRHPRAAQHLIGVVPDESNLYPELTGLDNLCFCGGLYGMPRRAAEPRAEELLKAVGLAAAAHRKFAGYSRGMKRKLTIAAALMHRPPLIFLDEPTTGIDVSSAREIRRMLLDLRQEGTTVLLTTHYIEEAERLCDRIAFLVRGGIVRTDTVEHLLQPVKDLHAMVFTLAEPPGAGLLSALGERYPDLALRVSESRLTAESTAPLPVGPLVALLEAAGPEVLEARRRRPTLEDVFVRITELDPAEMRREKERAGGRR